MNLTFGCSESLKHKPGMQQYTYEHDRLHTFRFSLRLNKQWLLVWFLILLLENCVLPLILYYGLRTRSDIKPWLICTLVTCVWGLILYVEYAIRAWKLAYRWSANRPLNSTHIALTERQSDRNESTPIEISQEEISIRQPSAVPLLPSHWYHDASHWLFSVTLTITLAELIIATVPKDPYIRLLAMVNPSMLFSISLFIFVLDVGYFLNMHAPFRISSLARGEYIRPGIYTLLEDVAAVDIGGGYTFRTEFNEHWETNAIFRRLLWKLSIFWSLPGLFVSVVCTAVIFTRDTEVGFAVGWGLPFIWAILWTVVTMGVTRGLNREKTSTQAAN